MGRENGRWEGSSESESLEEAKCGQRASPPLPLGAENGQTQSTKVPSEKSSESLETDTWWHPPPRVTWTAPGKEAAEETSQ